MNKHKEFITSVIERSVKTLIAERDCFYDGCSLPDGSVDDEHDKSELADMDSLINDLQEVLKIINPQRSS